MGGSPIESRPAVLVVDDEPDSVELLRISLGENYVVHAAVSGEEALERLAEHPEMAVAVIDQRMPGMTGTELIRRTIEPYPQLVRIILTGYTDVQSLMEAINAGDVFRYLTKPWDVEELLATVRQAVEVNRLAVDNVRLQSELKEANTRLRSENAMLKREAKGRYRFEGIVGASPALHHSLDLVERVAASDMTVLITGETGTGKELVARAIHYNGPRADKPFVSENCGAMAPELLTSELFGHKRGSFTSAAEDRRGLFDMADGGTLFLDEIADCPMELQTRLLRVLDQGEVRRVGDDRPRKVDVRIIAATNRNLAKAVEAGEFRQDLFYRLSVFSIELPPLRERDGDMPLLVEHFVREHNRRTGREVSGVDQEAMRRLVGHGFPGNVRELENVIERAAMLTDRRGEIGSDLLALAKSEDADHGTDGSLRSAVERLEAEMIRAALERHNGNQTHAAVELGLSRRGLIGKLDRYGLK